MAIDPTFTFSANSLQDYLDCPRRFELKYLLKQSWPAATSEPVLEFERHVQRGSQFHQLVHQYIHGIPQDILMATITDPDLADWFDNFLATYAKLEFTQVFPEQSVRIRLAGFQVVAIFDLLGITTDNQIHILDWKTSKFVPRKDSLSNRIQTRLYPLAALESAASFIGNQAIPAEQISLSYIYVQKKQGQNTVNFDYDQSRCTQNKAFLESLIAEIKDKAPGSFARTQDERKCKYCVYRSLCERGIAAGNFEEQEAEIDIEQLLENLDYEAQDEIAF
jgi:CRISPR/Cas system-associated exonuclease Cas4 (RecB family)